MTTDRFWISERKEYHIIGMGKVKLRIVTPYGLYGRNHGSFFGNLTKDYRPNGVCSMDAKSKIFFMPSPIPCLRTICMEFPNNFPLIIFQ